MILNKLIISKFKLEELIGETIAAIYLINKDNTRTPIKCDYETKIYKLDKSADYHILAARHSYYISQGVIE